MRHTLRIASSSVAALAVALGISAGAQAATEVTMSTSLPANNFLVLNAKQFVADAERLSGGNLKITFHTDGVLYKRAIHKRVLREGQIDLAEMDFNQYGNEDPMYVLINTPGLVNTLDELRALWELQKPYFDKLFADRGMRILYVGHWPGQGFYTRNPINTFADIKGQRLRISSVQTKQMGDMLGFNSTILPSAEVPQAFSTGLIDAMFTSAQTGVDTQAWDHVSHFALAVVGSATSAVAVNEASFQKLDKESQDALIEAGRLAYERSFPAIAEANVRYMKQLEENGMVAGPATDAMMEELAKVGASMVATWRETASPEALAILDAFYAKTGS